MKQTYMLKIKDVQKQLHKAKLEESAKKLLAYIALKEEVDPKLTEQLESELAEATTAIGVKPEMAEAAKKAVEGELSVNKRRQQKLHLDRIPAETEKSIESSPNHQSPKSLPTRESREIEQAGN
ncbi:hypothetical protein ACET3Z_008755 [Daucus carota]